MGKYIKFIFVIFISAIGFAQEQTIHISNDTFHNLYYDKGQIIPNHDRMKVVDYISEKIVNKDIPEDYSFRIEVGTCENEKKNDTFISYKRLEYLFNYLDIKYNLKKEKFQFHFSDSEFCDVYQKDNVSFVNFALQNCTVVLKGDSDIHNNISKKIFYSKNNIIPTGKGKKLLSLIGSKITDSNILDKYGLRVQIAICDKESKNNPLLSYERIEYLLNYLEEEYKIKREKVQFEFINNDKKNKTSFLRFVLIYCR